VTSDDAVKRNRWYDAPPSQTENGCVARVKINANRSLAAWLKPVILALFCIVLPIAAQAQSTLVFPKLVTPLELPNEGIAIANSGPTAATVTFTLYSNGGTAAATSTQTIPAGGQLARLLVEIFPSAATPGWVLATSSTPYLFGFWLFGDFYTYLDGGEAAPTASDLIFPLVTGSTQINVANSRSAATAVTLLGIRSDGSSAASVTHTIAGFGVLQAQVSDLFPGVDPTQIMYVRAIGSWGETGAPALAGTAVIQGYLIPTETAVLNAVDSTSTLATLNFPHAVSGPLGSFNYVTSIGVTNLISSAQNVTLTFIPETGAPITVVRPLPGNGALRDTAQNIFSLPAGFQNGWVTIAGPGPITGFVVYAETTSGQLTSVPVQATSQTSLSFAHIAGQPPWYTGVALLNATGPDASVEVTARTPDGTQIGSKSTFTLPAGQKVARVLSEWIPETLTQNGGFVSVRTTNNVPLYGIELFGLIGSTAPNLILADVASGIAIDCARPTSGPTTHTGSVNTETWTADKSPHIISSDITINGTVTIEACAEVLLGNQVTVGVSATGKIIASGLPTKPIHIGSSVAGKAFSQIRTFGGGTLHLSYVTIDGGGDPQNTLPYLTGTLDLQGADQTLPSQPTLYVDHVNVRDSKSNGIVLRDGAGFAPGSTNLTVTGSLQFPVSIWSRAVGGLPTGKYTGNSTDEILLPGTASYERVSESTTMHDRGVPYRVGHPTSFGILQVDALPSINTPTVLTIEPGVVLRFKKGGMMTVTSGVGTSPALGSLVAIGTPDKPVIFTSAEPVPAAGDWLGIWYGQLPSATNRTNYARIEYAGGASSSGSDACNVPPIGKQNDAAIRIFGVPAQGQFVTNTTIASSATHGIDRGWRNDFKPSFLPTNTFISIGRCTETYPRDTSGACPMTPPCPVP
jgi:hypothetical protein